MSHDNEDSNKNLNEILELISQIEKELNDNKTNKTEIITKVSEKSLSERCRQNNSISYLIKSIESFELLETFKKKSAAIIDKAKSEFSNEKIFENEDLYAANMVQDIMKGRKKIDLSEFGKDLLNKGLIKKERLNGFLNLIDDNGDRMLSEYELEVLLKACFRAARVYNGF